jgi:hypothetical protein
MIITLLLFTSSISLWASNPAGTGDYAQKVVLNEPFTKPPEASDVGWTGMFHHFHLEQVEDLNILRLRGNATRSDTSWLATPLTLYHGEWHYTISIDGDPSNSNRIDLVVMSDAEDLKSDFNGYLLKAGENGSNDVVRLMRVDKGVLTPILSGTTSIANGGTFRVRMVREPIGQWTMYVAEADGPFQLQGSSEDNTYGKLGYTGFRAIYTRTRNADYAIGHIQILQTQPQILHAELKGANALKLVMDSEIDPSSSLRLTTGGHLVSTRADIQNEVVEFELDTPLPTGYNSLQITGLTTANGNFVDVDASITLVVEAMVNPGDILINEYMYHPPEDVPQFVELVNVSDNRINLKGWELRDFGSGIRTISSTDIWFDPGGYIVLTPDSTVLSAYYSAPNVRQMARFPSLNRGSKDGVVLRTPYGVTIDSLAYSPSPAGDGVSIERRSLQAPTWAPSNWKPSAHRRGATPGEPNSHPPETPASPTLESAVQISPTSISLTFNSEIDASSLKNASINGIHRPFADCTTDDWKVILCISGTVLPVDADVPSRIEIDDVKDLMGNTLQRVSSPIAHIPSISDLLINEIMFNPLQSRYDGGSDQPQYIELVNPRKHHLYLVGLRLSTKSATSTTTSTISFNELSTAVVAPRSMVVLHADTTSTSTSRLSQFFGLTDSSAYYRSNRSTLSLSTTAGSVWILNGNNQTLDSVRYDTDFHYPSVRDRRGVSLERVSVSGSSIDPRNWASYAGLLGGSPGWPNSIVLADAPNQTASIGVYPNPFSPDNDGFEDVTRITVQFDGPGWLAKVNVFDRLGRKVRTLADGERVSATHDIYWNGLDDNNRRVFTGFYVIVLEAWHMETREKVLHKKVVGLIHQPKTDNSFK